MEDGELKAASIKKITTALTELSDLTQKPKVLLDLIEDNGRKRA